jgi:hypothetical protein
MTIFVAPSKEVDIFCQEIVSHLNSILILGNELLTWLHQIFLVIYKTESTFDFPEVKITANAVRFGFIKKNKGAHAPLFSLLIYHHSNHGQPAVPLRPRVASQIVPVIVHNMFASEDAGAVGV